MIYVVSMCRKKRKTNMYIHVSLNTGMCVGLAGAILSAWFYLYVLTNRRSYIVYIQWLDYFIFSSRTRTTSGPGTTRTQRSWKRTQIQSYITATDVNPPSADERVHITYHTVHRHRLLITSLWNLSSCSLTLEHSGHWNHECERTCEQSGHVICVSPIESQYQSQYADCTLDVRIKVRSELCSNLR